MDPIHPITPGPPAITSHLPVDPLQSISRERDRPAREREERPRRQPPPSPEDEHEEGDDGRPHVDVRA